MRRTLKQELLQAPMTVRIARVTETFDGFGVRSVVEDLQRSGFVMLPGLTGWLETLSPLTHREAWIALANPGVSALLHGLPSQKRRYFLNDEGQIDAAGQLSVQFAAKTEKNHMTFVEGSESVAASPLLPGAVQATCRIARRLSRRFGNT